MEHHLQPFCLQCVVSPTPICDSGLATTICYLFTTIINSSFFFLDPDTFFWNVTLVRDIIFTTLEVIFNSYTNVKLVSFT
uniref:Uncharacterized protein n=1 Tax=Pyxicephalus adspersus TaxID=30357 RepID=A0AAV3A3T9_PYXAD|nr:TPA: hypothetical protein GDO54_015458 [Pyxicephalus adspersus]